MIHNESSLRDFVDFSIIVFYFAATLFLGLFITRKQMHSTLRSYALANRQVPWWAVLGSIIAAETSAATFLGTPAEGFKSGSLVYCQLALGMILARILVAKLFIKIYYTHNVESIYEFLKTRFGPATKNAASLIFIIGRILGTGVRLYLGGVIFVVVWRSYFKSEPDLFHYGFGIITILLITTLYTTMGGIKAVIYTDVSQALLMLGGAVGACVLLYFSLPRGWATLSEELGGFVNVRFINWGFTNSLFENPYTIFAALIGMTSLTMATHGTDQDMVQRMLTAKNQKESRLALILSGLIDLPIALMFTSIGILLLVHYRIYPSPAVPNQLNEIFAFYIVNELPVGVRGLVVAGVFATIMGSTSAALNSLAVSLTKDWYQPYLNLKATEKQLTFFAKKATVACALLIGMIAVLTAESVRNNPTLTIIPLALGLMGMTYGSLLGIFLLGALTKLRGQDLTNVFAMVLGIVCVLLFGKIKILGFDFGSLMPMWWPVIAWPWYAVIGCLITFGSAVPFRPRP